MKITFEDDDGTAVVLDLPDIKLRREVIGAEELPRYFGLDPREELLGGITAELFWRLMLGKPTAAGKIALRHDVNPLHVQTSELLSEICKMLVDAEQGSTVNFWATRK